MQQSSAKSVLSTTAVDRYFEIALYLLVVTGFATLSSTGGLGLIPVVLVATALLYRGYLLATRRVFIIPEGWTTFLTLIYLGFYVFDYLLLARGFLNATIHLVLFVMVVRLFSAQRDRDHYFLAVISFLMVLAASVLTVDSTFLLTFSLFLLTAVATFILMEMRRSAKAASLQARSENQEQTAHKMAISLATISPALVMMIFLGAAAIFFLLPRVSSGYLSAYSPGGDIATGFTDVVQLGRIGQIQQSTALVMHIQIDGDSQGTYDLKWRGVSLDLFDGKTWSNPHEQRFLPRSSEGRFVLPPPAGRTHPRLRESAARTIHYRVLMEPVSSNVFFLAAAAVALQGNYRMIAADAGGSIFNLDPDHPITRYDAISDLDQPSPAELRTASEEYPPKIVMEDLQLPPMDPRVAQLAQTIANSATTNYDKAVAVDRYLQTHFGYTLQLPRATPRDPVANFLFERKQGHCEYFAASMAVMLRTLRIPSRVVNGFRTGEFNDLTSQYLVRASNAHAWVEVYFPGYGWVSFDPTPGSLAAPATGWGRVMLYVDAMASFWRDWVVSYDSNHQYTLGRRVARNGFVSYEHMRLWARRHYEQMLDAARRTQTNVTNSPGRWSIAGGLAIFILSIAANLGRMLRAFRIRRIAAQPERAPSVAATIWYRRMIQSLAKRGWRKSPTQTPKEFADSLTGSRIHGPMTKFTENYERARFGNSPQDAGRLPELFEEVSTASRR